METAYYAMCLLHYPMRAHLGTGVAGDTKRLGYIRRGQRLEKCEMSITLSRVGHK